MLQGQSRILELRGDITGALRLGQQSLTCANEAADPTLVVDALNAIGNVEWRRHAHDAAESTYQQALTLTRQLGDRARTAALLGNLGAVALNREAFARADPLLQECVAMARDLGDQVAWAKGLCNLGASAYRQGRRNTARRHYREALGLLEQSDEWQTIPIVLDNCALIAVDEHAYEQAAAFWRSGGALRASWDQLSTVRRCCQRPQPPRARRPRGAGRIGLQCVESPRQSAAVESSHRAGHRGNATGAPGARGGLWRRLSPREREVVALITQGLTNRQIGERLVIAERTANTHVQNILAKLGCAARSEVAALVLAEG
ncbi:MAG: LuxR C-terminal-related transcriptional regulator [Chloroflexota bacterium]